MVFIAINANFWWANLYKNALFETWTVFETLRFWVNFTSLISLTRLLIAVATETMALLFTSSTMFLRVAKSGQATFKWWKSFLVFSFFEIVFAKPRCRKMVLNRKVIVVVRLCGGRTWWLFSPWPAIQKINFYFGGISWKLFWQLG